MNRRSERGMTLVQLLVGTAVGLTVTAGLGMFFIQGSRSSREDINIATMLNELGYATGQLTADLEMAGFWAQVHDPATIDADASLAVSADCGAAGWYKDLRSLALLDNPTAAEIHDEYPCLREDEVVAGSDVVAIKRVAGRVVASDTDSAGLRGGMIYLRTHERFGRLFLHGAGGPAAVETPYQDWEYAPALYYVQKFSVRATESPQIPSLCRMTLRAGSAAPSFERECVAQGVENLQVEVGVDSDEDGGANYFTPTPTAAELTRVSNARLYLQVRSARPDLNYTNAKTYQIGNAAPFTPAGADVHYYRKTLTSEVVLRNPRSLQGVAVQ